MLEKKQLLQSIRITTVDDFQGEEAKVIIVSLVRSNHNAKRNPPVGEFKEAKPFPPLFVPGSVIKSTRPINSRQGLGAVQL